MLLFVYTTKLNVNCFSGQVSVRLCCQWVIVWCILNKEITVADCPQVEVLEVDPKGEGLVGAG